MPVIILLERPLTDDMRQYHWPCDWTHRSSSDGRCFADDPSTTTYHSVAEGEQLELDCSGREQTDDVITWYKDGRVVYEDFSHVLTMSGAVLTVRDLQPSDRGRYECVVTDRPTGDVIRRQTFVVTEGGLSSLIHIYLHLIQSDVLWEWSIALCA